MRLDADVGTTRAWARIVFVVFERVARNLATGHTILFAYPLAKIDELATFRAKGAKWIILPLDLFVAGRTLFHEPNAAQIS
jgi:hypothetical protein